MDENQETDTPGVSVGLLRNFGFDIIIENNLIKNLDIVREREENMSIVEEAEFKGNPMIVLKNNEEDQYPFQFGVKKAKLVLENIEAIKKFVEKNDKTQ